MSENIILAAFWFAVLLGAFFIVTWVNECSSELNSDKSLLKKNNPEEYSKTLCNYKKSGSRPACWTEGDWIAFCKRVKCEGMKE